MSFTRDEILGVQKNIHFGKAYGMGQQKLLDNALRRIEIPIDEELDPRDIIEKVMAVEDELFDDFVMADGLRHNGVDLPPGKGLEGEDIYLNSLYQVNVRVFQKSPEDPIDLWHLSIKRRDKRPVADWRHKQWIKNFFCGDETLGVEVFPPESKLVDTANQYHLWVTPHLDVLPFIFQKRTVMDHVEGTGSRQRPWPKNRRPTDLMNEEEYKRKLEEYLKQGVVE